MARSWFKVKAKADDAAADAALDVSIYDEIGMWGVSAKDFIAQIQASDAPAINLSINSPGGDVFAGLAIFNALRMSGKTVNVTVMGIAASAASLIAMAGDKIIMPANAFMMIHNPWSFAVGNADEMRETADVLDKIGASLASVYVSRTGQSAEKIAEMLAADTYLTAEQSKELGFADEITESFAAKASFDLDNLPEHVRAVFASAAEPAAEETPDAVAAAEAEAAAEAQAAADAAAAAQVAAANPFADTIVAAVEQAGMPELAPVLALDSTVGTKETLDAAIALALETRAICKAAQMPDEARALIAARKPLAEVRAHLIAARAETDEASHTDTTRKATEKAVAGKPQASFTAAEIWKAARTLAK